MDNGDKGKFVFIPGECPNCGKENTMFSTQVGPHGKVNIRNWSFKCIACEGRKEYDWWVLWTFVKDIEEEMSLN